MRKIIPTNQGLICSILFLSLLQINGISQSFNDKHWKQYYFFVGGSVGLTQTNISNYGSSVISDVSIIKKRSFCFSIDAGYFFSKYFGLSTGIGIAPYFTQLSLDSYENNLDTIDSENESYERRISGNNITETEKIYFIEIPFMFNFQYLTTRTSGFFVNGGINLSIPVIKNYSSSGTFSYSGYYPTYNVLIKDISYEGFKSNVESETDGELKLKTINPEMMVSAGYYFYPNKQYQISLGFFYKRVFSDISDYNPVSSFQLSTQENQIKSFMEGSDKVTPSSIGIVVSLRYFIK